MITWHLTWAFRQVSVTLWHFITCRNFISASMLVGSVCLFVCLFVCLSVCLSHFPFLLDNLSNFALIDLKLSQNMHLGSRKNAIEIQRVTLKVKVTRGQKVKNFDTRYLRNYWTDFLLIKLKIFSSVRALILGMSLPVPTSGKKARPRSKVIHTFSVITQ